MLSNVAKDCNMLLRQCSDYFHSRSKVSKLICLYHCRNVDFLKNWQFWQANELSIWFYYCINSLHSRTQILNQPNFVNNETMQFNQIKNIVKKYKIHASLLKVIDRSMLKNFGFKIENQIKSILGKTRLILIKSYTKYDVSNDEAWEKIKCKICSLNKIDAVLYPCGHAFACATCLEGFIDVNDKCLCCGDVVQSVRKLYV